MIFDDDCAKWLFDPEQRAIRDMKRQAAEDDMRNKLMLALLEKKGRVSLGPVRAVVELHSVSSDPQDPLPRRSICLY